MSRIGGQFKQNIQCDDYGCYDNKGKEINVVFPKEYTITYAAKSIMYFDKNDNKVKFKFKEENEVKDLKLSR